MTDLPQLIDELRRLSAAATKGPWCVEDIFEDGGRDICLDYEIKGAGSPISVAHIVSVDEHGYCPKTIAEVVAISKLIATMRNNIDALLDALESARANERRYLCAKRHAVLIDDLPNEPVQWLASIEVGSLEAWQCFDVALDEQDRLDKLAATEVEHG